LSCDVVLRDRSSGADDRVVAIHKHFVAEPVSAGEARAFVTTVLDKDSGVPPAMVWTALLLTSELVTNAVLHARTHLRVGVARDDYTLLIAVTDSGPPPEHGGDPPGRRELEESGRGMQIVASIADDFGWQIRPDDGGKTMWALIDFVPALD
jgi:anti-sigma regulatory factor (Ser/Thr protein kinase)